MDEGPARHEAPVPELPRVTVPRRLQVQISAASLRGRISRRPRVWPDPGRPIVTLAVTEASFDPATTVLPALLIHEEGDPARAIALAKRVLATRTSALILAPTVPPELAALAAGTSLLRVLPITFDLPDRAAQATEALVRFAAYRRLRLAWQGRAVALRDLLACRGDYPPVLVVPDRAPIPVTLWAHVRMIAGVLFSGPTNVHLHLGTCAETARRVRADAPRWLLEAAVGFPAFPVDPDEIRRSLQHAEAVVRGLDDELRAQALPEVDDPALTLRDVEAAAIEAALERAGSVRAAAQRLGISRERCAVEA